MIKTDKHILFITISNLANNPRLYKEACLALDNNISITIIQFLLGNWSDGKTQNLEKELNSRNKNATVVIETLDATRANFIQWLYHGIIEKCSRIVYPLFSGSLRIAAYAHARRSAQIISHLRNNKTVFNLISAHNLGALYPASKLSDKTNTPFTFDVEDYHPEECISDSEVDEKKRRVFLMQKLIPKAAFYTSASPLIGEYTEILVGFKDRHRVILNAFPTKEFKLHTEKRVADDTLKFVWFSQNIAFGRGLEQFFDGLTYWLNEKQNKKVSITLIGHIYEDFQDYINEKFGTEKLKKQVQVEHISPLSQQELHQKLSDFDIGIASEQITSDFNREICLTNKIIAYAQAGLYILATDTKAQVDFLKRYNGIGVINNSKPDGFIKSLDYISDNWDDINANKSQRLQIASKLNWETESKVLLEVWNKIIQ